LDFGTLKLALIGFVFSRHKSGKISISTFGICIYIHFCLLQIGFVFSNRIPKNAVVSDLELRASDFQPRPGDWL